MLRKKKSFTLIEIIIGMLLGALLVGGLFEIQRQFNILQNKVEQTKQIVFGRERLYARLTQIFTNLDDCWIDNNSLVLKYASTLDPDRAFRGDCLSLIHQDGNSLVLTTYTKDTKQEVLLKLDKHATLHFSVFDSKTSKWIEEWPRDFFKKNPSTPKRRMLKITIDLPTKKQNIEFPFWIDQ